MVTQTKIEIFAKKINLDHYQQLLLININFGTIKITIMENRFLMKCRNEKLASTAYPIERLDHFNFDLMRNKD